MANSISRNRSSGIWCGGRQRRATDSLEDLARGTKMTSHSCRNSQATKGKRPGIPGPTPTPQKTPSGEPEPTAESWSRGCDRNFFMVGETPSIKIFRPSETGGLRRVRLAAAVGLLERLFVARPLPRTTGRVCLAVPTQTLLQNSGSAQALQGQPPANRIREQNGISIGSHSDFSLSECPNRLPGSLPAFQDD